MAVTMCSDGPYFSGHAWWEGRTELSNGQAVWHNFGVPFFIAIGRQVGCMFRQLLLLLLLLLFTAIEFSLGGSSLYTSTVRSSSGTNGRVSSVYTFSTAWRWRHGRSKHVADLPADQSQQRMEHRSCVRRSVCLSICLSVFSFIWNTAAAEGGTYCIVTLAGLVTGIWRRIVVCVVPDVSTDHSAVIFRVHIYWRSFFFIFILTHWERGF